MRCTPSSRIRTTRPCRCCVAWSRPRSSVARAASASTTTPGSSLDPVAQERREKDRPWVMRTYSGHSTARASNELYRTNLARGQTGLSIAFDLPTQTGYDPDSPEAAGEVGKVGVPVAHLG